MDMTSPISSVKKVSSSMSAHFTVSQTFISVSSHKFELAVQNNPAVASQVADPQEHSSSLAAVLSVLEQTGIVAHKFDSELQYNPAVLSQIADPHSQVSVLIEVKSRLVQDGLLEH